MTTLRRFELDDLFKFNNINLDPLTETFNMPFYLSYLSQWPECFTVAEAPDGTLMGYVIGKAEVCCCSLFSTICRALNTSPPLKTLLIWGLKYN